MTGIIYKLTVGDYHYIGRTTQTFRARYMAHRKSCFNRSKKSYHTKIYKMFRKLGVNKENWIDMVKYVIVYKPKLKYIDYYEYACININHPYNLNTINKEVYEKYEREFISWGTNKGLSKKQIDKNYYLTIKDNEDYKYNKHIRYLKDKQQLGFKKRMKSNKDKYMIKNRDKVNARKRVKVICLICNCMISKNGKWEHNNSIKHLTNELEYID